MKRKWTLLVVAALALALAPVGSALATPLDPPPPDMDPNMTLELTNDTATLCAYADCGDLGGWHFVISPNNNQSYFVEFHLNLGDATAVNTGTYDTTVFVPLNSDNVWVAVPTVPAGKTYLSLQKQYSTADIYWSGEKTEPFQFQLSNVCAPKVPEPSTLLLLGSGLFGLGLMRRRRD